MGGRDYPSVQHHSDKSSHVPIMSLTVSRHTVNSPPAVDAILEAESDQPEQDGRLTSDHP